MLLKHPWTPKSDAIAGALEHQNGLSQQAGNSRRPTMFDRIRLGTLLLTFLVVPFIGCGSSSQIDSIAVAPATVAFGGVGLTAQLTATGTIGHGSHPSTTEDVTKLVTWSTGSADVATVGANTGLVTSTGPGVIQITATMQGFTGTLTSTSTVTVSVSTTGTGPGADVTTLSIIPGSQAVASANDTGQFIAIGTTAGGVTENLTNAVTWSSSTASVATIGPNTGLATATGKGTSTITALYKNSDGTVATGIATFTVTGGSSEAITALTILPGAQSVSASGQTGQFVALGTSGSTGLSQNVTNVTSSPSGSIAWSSSIPSIATICTAGSPAPCTASTNGLVTGVSAGTSAITALWTNADGSVVSATANVTVAATAAPEPLLSLQIVPNTIAVGNLQGTGNFLAIGTFSTVPYVRDLTNSVTWLSSAPEVFPVSTNSGNANPGAAAGTVTAYGNGSATIIAEATSSDGTIQTATATFNCPLVLPNPTGNPPTAGSCYPGTQASGLLVTLTVYNEGLNTSNWLITAPSATNTPNVLHCGPGWTTDGNTGGSVCTATYPVGTNVILTAPGQLGVNFGGWSYNCAAVLAVNAPGPNSCEISLGAAGNSNVTVGAIFN
jgi:uncharacterized protein YjdB